MKMIQLKMILSHLFAIIGIASALHTCPVFVQDEGLLDGTVKSQSNPMIATNREEFELIVDIANKYGDCLLFFVEDELSFEDISSVDEVGTPFLHLKKAFSSKRLKFFPRVVEPYDYLKNRFQPFDFNTFHVSPSTKSLQLGDETDKFMYIFFEDGANETRIQRLRRHDAVIQDVYLAVKQLTKGPVVAFYTGKRNPMRRQKQPVKQLKAHSPEEISVDLLVAHCGDATFQFDAVLQDPLTGILSPLTAGKCEYASDNINTWTYRIPLKHLESYATAPYELRLSFTHKDPDNRLAGWKLEKVEYLSPNKGTLKTKYPGSVDEWNHTFESRTPLILFPEPRFPGQPTLMLKSYRINLNYAEAQRRKIATYTELTSTNEGDATASTIKTTDLGDVDYVPEDAFDFIYFRASGTNETISKDVFITIAIATCELLVFMLLGFLFFGVHMIMSIHTNDIYDSSDQKPLFTGDMAGD